MQTSTMNTIIPITKPVICLSTSLKAQEYSRCLPRNSPASFDATSWTGQYPSCLYKSQQAHDAPCLHLLALSAVPYSLDNLVIIKPQFKLIVNSITHPLGVWYANKYKGLMYIIPRQLESVAKDIAKLSQLQNMPSHLLIYSFSHSHVRIIGQVVLSKLFIDTLVISSINVCSW